MKKRISVIRLIGIGLIMLCFGAFVFIKNYKPLVVRKERPLYGGKIVAEVRLDSIGGIGYELEVYTVDAPLCVRRTLLKKELKTINSFHSPLRTEDVEIGGEGGTVTVTIRDGKKTVTESCRLR